MAGINQIPKLSFWASSNDVNKMITSLNQVLIDLQTNLNNLQTRINTVAATPAKAIVVPTFGLLPMDLEDGSLAVTRDTLNMYVFTAGTWEKIVTV